MQNQKKALVIIIAGVLLAGGGTFLRLNAQHLAMQAVGGSPMTDPGGAQIGTAIWSTENKSRSAALADVGIGLLATGCALLVVGAAGWVFAPKPGL